MSASSSRSGFAAIVGYYKDSRHRNRRAHEPQKDQFIYKQTLSCSFEGVISSVGGLAVLNEGAVLRRVQGTRGQALTAFRR